MSIQEFCISYNTPHFEETSSFFTDIFDCTPSISWNNPDGRGAFFIVGGNGVIEIFAAADGHKPFTPPPSGSFMIVIMVDDVDQYASDIVRRGGTIKYSMVEHDWGRYFGIEDPNDVEIYFMQRLGENVLIAKKALQQAIRKDNRKRG